jgi:1-acyl-sn-glycerol-3-phosphate acyltransferase
MMNHISIIDPIVLTAVIEKRYVIAMAKSESADNPFTNFFINLWGNFTVQRGEVDRSALTSAIELLKAGNLVLMAPEGTRSPDGLIAPRSGVAYIAHRAHATVVPAAICAAQDWANRLKRLKRAYVRVHFGRPFQLILPEGQRMTRPIREQMMQEAMYQLAQAIPDEYAHQRGVFHDIQNATTDYLAFVK